LKWRELEARGQRFGTSQSDLATVSTCVNAFSGGLGLDDGQNAGGSSGDAYRGAGTGFGEDGGGGGRGARKERGCSRSASAVGVALGRSQRQRRAEEYLEYSVGRVSTLTIGDEERRYDIKRGCLGGRRGFEPVDCKVRYSKRTSSSTQDLKVLGLTHRNVTLL